MIRVKDDKPSHSVTCREWKPECICLSCAHDNYRKGTYVQCCYKHGKGCPVERCRDYRPETPDGEMTILDLEGERK